MKKNEIMITGVAGFIGFSLARSLLKDGTKIIGIDNINNYYSTKIKIDRLKILKKYKNFTFYKQDIRNKIGVKKIFNKHKLKIVYHFAAQAGVRHSIKKPDDYVSNNLVGFFNILDCSRLKNIKHFIFASTSSVYGLNKKLPFEEKDEVNHPSQFYASTKRSNELMAHSYSCIYNMNCTGLRFFTVYGPWGRPDMALFKFVENIISNKPIKIFNYGKHLRDFSYIDDVVNCLKLIMKKYPKKKKNFISSNPSESSAPFQILNIGNQSKVKLMDYIREIEKNIGIVSKKKYYKLQLGDIPVSYSKMTNTNKIINYKFKVNYKIGVKNFVFWFNKYFKIKFD